MTTHDSTKISSPITVGAINLEHRMVLAPLTRLRANVETAVPANFTALYYGQRASSGGLLISEGTFIAQEAGGIPCVPGIYSEDQITAWKPITQAVHDKGGYIFCQLWALGRVASPDVVSTVWSAGSKPHGQRPNNFKVLTEADIERFVEHFRQAAQNAIEAGFDGVEIHGANGYLIDQFIQSVSNDRTDSYGGSLENRFRFPLKVLNAVCDAIGPERVGIRMSPFTRFQGMREADPLSVFVPWAHAIVKAQPSLAYIHATEARADDDFDDNDTPNLVVPETGDDDSLDPIRNALLGTTVKFIVAGGYTAETAIDHACKTDDLIAFGRYFIANPDLPARIKNGWPLSKYDRSRFYSNGKDGYIDYPVYDPSLHRDAPTGFDSVAKESVLVI